MRVLFAIWLLAGTARADVSARDMAREHFKHGMAQYLLNHYDAAIPEFEAGFAADPQAGFLYNLAQCHAKLGHTREALEFFHKYLEFGAPPGDVASVQAAIDQLEKQLPPSVAPPVTPAVEPASTAPPAAVAERPKKRRWPIAVGVIAGVVVVGVAVGLGAGLSVRDSHETALLWNAR